MNVLNAALACSMFFWVMARSSSGTSKWGIPSLSFMVTPFDRHPPDSRRHIASLVAFWSQTSLSRAGSLNALDPGAMVQQRLGRQKMPVPGGFPELPAHLKPPTCRSLTRNRPLRQDALERWVLYAERVGQEGGLLGSDSGCAAGTAGLVMLSVMIGKAPSLWGKRSLEARSRGPYHYNAVPRSVNLSDDLLL
jgi:hypothetical protein